jgi:predicted HNH restriction endonuclease
VYSQWGRGFAEVHHVELLEERPRANETDPAKDLAVLGSNRRRMNLFGAR